MTNWSIASTPPPPSPPAEARPAAAGSVAVWLPVAAVAAAMLIQGAAGRPAPPSFRPEIEGVIAVLLAAAAAWPRPALACRWGALCLAVLLWIPLLRSAVAGWPLSDVVRDTAPLLFLFLPLVLVPALRPAGRDGARVLAAALMVEGLFYGLRWWNHADWGFGALGVRVLSDGGGYLLNAPSVLFAAVAWPLLALHLAERGGLRSLCLAALAGAAGALCAAALLGAAHRLAVGLIVIAAAAALWTRARRSPRLLPAAAALALVAVAAEGERLAGALFQVAEKTRVAGGNTRIEEATAALTAAGESGAAALFGAGWGARLENPAVGGWRVAYTHTFITYLVFKAGVLGLAAMTAWLAAFTPAVRALWRRDPAWTLALTAPLAVAFSVHTSFKYLDTGVLLTLLILWAETNGDKEGSAPAKRML